jgi:hypothetical protein
MDELDLTNTISPHERGLACVGELRAAQLSILDHLRAGLDVLTAAPGHRALPGTAHGLYERPSMQLSVRLARELQSHLVLAFAADIDALPKGSLWGELLLAWATALRSGDARVRFWDQSPLYTRLISRPDKSLVFAEPVHDDFSLGNELRLNLTGDEHLRARRWFHELFEHSQDISQEVVSCIDESWAGNTISARDAYLKVLATYFDEVLQSLDRDIDTNPMLSHLTEFQVEAYHYAKFILRRFGGVFLADVVGLGKTYIALAMLKAFQDTSGEHAVIVAPPKVLPAWEALAAEHRVEVKLVSLGKLSTLSHYAEREILVVDESHNLRNSNTDRYSEISEWVRPAGEPATRKVILLSATPQNNSISDIRSQLRLFPDNFVRLPIKAESLDAWCKEVRSGARSASELLQHVVVRRTRSYIRAAFPTSTLKQRQADGTYQQVPIRFPRRRMGPEQCLRYSLTDTYHSGIYRKILQGLRTLNYPLHSLGDYLSLEGATDERTLGLKKARNSVRALFKVLLLKRLESSVHAFRASLERLRTRLDGALGHHARGFVLLAKEASGDDEDDEGDEGHAERSLPLSLFEPTRLEKAIREDHIEVKSMLSLVEDLDPSKDAKLHRLLRFLERRP